jgi:hypothetical protein
LEVDEVRRLLPALLAALGCAACTAPIFDPVASLAGDTIRHLSVYLATDMLPMPNDYDFNVRRDTFTFLPERNGGVLTPDRGFVIRAREGKSEIWYEWKDGGVQWLNANWTYSADEPMLPRWPVSLKDGSYLMVFSLDSPEGQAYTLTVDTGGKVITQPSTNLANFIQSDLDLASTPQVVGVSVNPEDSLIRDRLRVLVREGGSFSEARADVNAAGIGTYTATPFGKEYPLPFLGEPWRLRYFRDMFNLRSFAQSYDSETDTWTTWVWWGTGGTENASLTAVTRRIDALLSRDAGPATSTFLLSTEGEVGRVYEYDGTTGKLVAEFPLGSLRFIGEAYLDGVWRMLFSRCMADSGAGEIQFEIRAIDSADLVDAFKR